MSTATEDLAPATAAGQFEGPTPLAAVVPLSDCYPSPSNPRKHFHALPELALSIAKKGIIQPLVVRTRETAQGRLEVVDGERRHRAATQAGLQFVPVIFRDELTDSEVLELQIENALQRADLTPLEEARGFKALLTSNTSKYSPAYIADRISRSERFVVDRMRLLDLIPVLQQLLEQERIGVAHAELLAKLTPEDQARASSPGDADGYRVRLGGLWAGEERTLGFDEEENDEPDTTRDLYAGLKVVTVKELEAWIARHVRFDVERMATTAPLEFGRVASLVQVAAAQPGRGKKVVEITHDHHLADDVKDPKARVFGPRSWKRADDTVASVRDDRGRMVDALPCEHAVLGVVAVGPEYGTAFQVCLARDKCKVHWAAEIKALEKTRSLLASGKTAAATKETRKAEESWETREKREQAERAKENAVYAALHATLTAALRAAAPKTLDETLFAWLRTRLRHEGKAPKLTPKECPAALIVADLRAPDPKMWHPQGAMATARELAKAFGVDIKPLEKAARATAAAADKAAAATAPATKKPTAKKTGAKKATRSKK